jgi:hypothetical protein
VINKIVFAMGLSLATFSFGKPTPEPDKVESYHRSQAEAKTPGSFQDFGLVDGDRITLILNGSLIDEQAPQVCEDRPIEKIVTPPKNERRCARTTDDGCAWYEERYPGEGQPNCEIPSVMSRIFPKRKGECNKRVDPNPPTVITYRTAKDCYRAQPRPQSLGQVTIYAVPSGTERLAVTQRGRALGTFNLSSPGASQAINIGGQTRAGECLALADSAGTPISVRKTGNAASEHLFMTASMAALKDQTDTQSRLNAAQQRKSTAQAEINRQARLITESGAWNGSTCAMPPMAALPPAPNLLPATEISQHARANCTIVLSNKVGEMEVQRGIMSRQAYDYVAAIKAKGTDPTKYDRCTWRAYDYPSGQIAYITGETVNYEVGRNPGAGWAGVIQGMMTGVPQQISVTGDRKERLIVDMLNECTAATVRACSEPQASYSERVQAVRDAPQKALRTCEEGIQTIRALNAEAQQADQDAKTLANTPAPSATQRGGALPLSAATCAM